MKCDIKRYFETVDHTTLLNIIKSKVKDDSVIWLTKTILENYTTDAPGKGMPLGNWTSQFFANVYLNELDQYIKHVLKAKYYIRYVDDFIILHESMKQLLLWKEKINRFLEEKLSLQLHPQKCHLIPLKRGVCFLGFRIFYHHKLVRSRNLRKMRKRMNNLISQYYNGKIPADEIVRSVHGWNAYAIQADTYSLRNKLQKEIEESLDKK